MDETGVTWAIGPTHMFVPESQARATGSPHAKVRITAIVAVNGLGRFAPLMIILKHSISSLARPDQTGMKICSKLNKTPGFKPSDGWVLGTWERDLMLPAKKKGEFYTATHKCLFLRHEGTNHIITSQFKAWNDTVRMAMWVDLVMKPIRERDGRMLIWADNCGPHKTKPIEELFQILGIHTAFLPPNMTGLLQVLDLVVNGPIKAHIRRIRALRIVQAFHMFKDLYRQ